MIGRGRGPGRSAGTEVHAARNDPKPRLELQEDGNGSELGVPIGKQALQGGREGRNDIMLGEKNGNGGY